MRNDEVRAIVAAAYQRFEETILASHIADDLPPPVRNAVLRTLRQLQKHVEADPASIEEIVRLASPKPSGLLGSPPES